MKWRRIAAVLLTVWLTISPPAHAWHDFGHMLVAYIAYQNLTPASRERANALLKLNPMYTAWIEQMPASLPESEKDARVFMIAATWPDAIKKDPSYQSDGNCDGNRPDATDRCTQNVGYSDHYLHKYWHFYDQPFSRDGTKLPTIPSPNAQTQISLFRSILASDAPDALKSYDLVWLLHIIGDIHQPLHCTARVSKAEPDGDNGGNNVKLNADEKQLHTFWDGVIGESGIEAVPDKARTLKPANKRLANQTDEHAWFAESIDLSQKKIYRDSIKEGNGPFDISRDYRKKALKLSEQRVELAGERLARLINDNLK